MNLIITSLAFFAGFCLLTRVVTFYFLYFYYPNVENPFKDMYKEVKFPFYYGISLPLFTPFRKDVLPKHENLKIFSNRALRVFYCATLSTLIIGFVYGVYLQNK